MHHISISDQLFDQAQHAAAANGLSVSAFIAGLIAEATRPDSDNYDHLFTPQVLAELDSAADEAQAGGSLSIEEVEAHFAAKREAWLKTHPR